MKNDVRMVELETENQQLRQQNDHLQQQLDWLMQQVKLLRSHRFGASSEKSSTLEGGDQLGFFDETEADECAPVPAVEQATSRRRKQKGKRDKDFSALPTEQIVYSLPEDERICPDCGGSLHACGHDVLRRELTVIPAQFKVTEHVQTVYSCRACEQNSDHTPMKKSFVPAPVIPKSGVASPSILAYLIHQKYTLALPFYRQQQELKRLGVNLSRQTQANWMIYSSETYLQPIFEAFRAELLKNQVLHADETVMQVLHEAGKPAQSDSYLWLYRTSGCANNQVVLFEYQSSREAVHPKRFLRSFQGYLHTDGYAGYHDIQGVEAVGCWAHLRRKFADILKTLPKALRAKTNAQIGLDYCNRMFKLEENYTKCSASERFERRKEESVPLAERFFAWAAEIHPKTTSKSLLGVALTYALNQRGWLMHVFKDGRLELSNNLAERSIRPFTIGRKNWLFCNTPKGAKASAVIYSMIETAKANGLKPFEYLRFLLENLSQGATPESCLPWNPALPACCKA